MDFMKLFLDRESCRAYCDKPVTREQLMEIVEAGRLSPSGCNAQPWKFIVVDEPEAKEKLCDALLTNEGTTGSPWRGQVPAFIIIVEQPAQIMKNALDHFKDTQRFAQGDIGMAAMNMAYAAMGQGLSTCFIGLFEEEKLEKHFGIPADREVRLVLAVGYAKDDNGPRKKIRKPMEEVCSFNKW